MAAWDENNSSGFWPKWHENKAFTVLVGILLVYLIVLVGAQIKKTLAESEMVGIENYPAPSIVVTAEGKTTVVPDVAVLDLGVDVTASTAEEAQDNNTGIMNALVAAMKEFGIAEADMQTSSYSVHPQYDYDVSPPTIVGYAASQRLTVRVRETESVGEVMASAGNLGATSVGSLRFEVDNPTQATNEAREEAIAKAHEQAEDIARAMGVDLGGIVSYYESTGGVPEYRSYANAEFGLDAAAEPTIEEGSTDVFVSVSVTYALDR